MFVANKSKIVEAEIRLPSSKSISNRVLILNYLSNKKAILKNLSNSNDTKILLRALNSNSNNINIEDCGTAMRFLTAYFSIKNKDIVITGASRMKYRPIKPLIDALNNLGARISILDGKHLLEIKRRKLSGGTVKINADVSSQFITALLLIAHSFKDGLKIELEGKVYSKPYIDITLYLLEKYGVKYSWDSNIITVFHAKLFCSAYCVESDWSAAAFWYEIIALSKRGKVLLKGLEKNSIQGDSVLPSVFNQLGVKTTFNKYGCLLEKHSFLIKKLEFNFRDFPDLFLPIACTCAGLNITANLTGLDLLPNKESNRIKALKIELEKCGKIVKVTNSSVIISGHGINDNQTIDTFNDHRIAMSFAPLSLKSNAITINNSKVVSKSYPNYWDDLLKAGFTIS